MLAARFNNYLCVGELLKRKELEINAVDNEGNTALMYGARSAEPDSIELLLNDARIDVNIVNKAGLAARDIGKGSGRRGKKRKRTRQLLHDYDEKHGLTSKVKQSATHQHKMDAMKKLQANLIKKKQDATKTTKQ